MSSLDIDKFYISPYDKFMREFDINHQKTPSQIQEIDKHKRIAELRDNPITTDVEGKIWADF